MLVLKLEMWPLGSEDQKREIGRMYIASVSDDANDEIGDYSALVAPDGATTVPYPFNCGGPPPLRTGRVLGYPRLRHNVWRLVTRALRSCFPEEK